ncbi:hypothetical protein G6F22_018669 [Rhizopus arrhizus]|nr:hypothetical protein G6F22_018669 [Rhizopus arrhizus]
MQQQQFQQAAGQCRIMRIAKHEALHRLLRGLLQCALEELLLQVEQAAALGHCTTHRAQPGSNLVADGERERQQAIHRFLHTATRTGLLDGHADRAVEIRIGGAVHRREVVEVLAGVVQRAQRIQCLRMGSTDCACSSATARSSRCCPCPSRGSRSARSGTTGGTPPPSAANPAGSAQANRG